MNPSDEIKQKIDIVDFIREYIPVKAAGANFQALCPFHGEKTPSFVISPEKQIWHCFGCGKGGDLFSFVMEMEGLGFVEAVRLLAPRAGVTLRHENPEAYSKRNRLLDIMALSVKYYHHLLNSSVGQKSLEYLRRRGLSQEIIDEWQIGYSPDSWDSLSSFLVTRPVEGKKYNAEEMFEAGLVIKKEGSSNRYYDRFRDRLMFPVYDVSGNPIAYSARINPDKEAAGDKMGKYINSPQNAIYDKSRVLFGLDKAKNHIKAKDLVIVVEGQMDAITCHQFGFKNAVASSGTALTTEQITLLKRYTNNIALCFDADKAGQLAADRGIKEAMAQGMNIKVIIIPNGKDPDDALRQDLASFVMAVRDAKPMMDYLFAKVIGDLDLRLVENKKLVASKMLDMITKLANRVEADYWLKILAQTLDIDENVLRESLPNEKESQTAPKQIKIKESATRSREEQLSELLLAIIVRFPDFIYYVISKLEPDWLETEFLGSFYKNLIIYYNKNNALDYAGFREYLSGEGGGSAEILDRLILLGEKDFYAYEKENVQSEIIKIIVELKKYYLQRKISLAQKAMALAEQNGEIDKINQILEELKVLTDSQRNNQIS
ncbi:MAG: DNA primase [Candidatus Falkowbacteria bacterium]